MADAKISSFASGTPASADLLTFVSDPSGTPANEVITYSAFVSGLTITESQISDLGTYATQAYVDSAVAGLYDHKGAYNASTNSPDLDTSPSGVLKGDAYTVSVAGTFFSASVDAGDVLIADQDSPTLESHWTIVNRNIDESAFAGSSHTHAASDITSGTLSHERGGLEADVSAYAGVPLIDSGSTSEVKYNLTATTDPGVGDDSDDGYTIGSRWVNVTLDKEFVCLDASVGAAVWSETSHVCCSGSGSEAYKTLTDATTITIDQHRGDDFKVTLGGNRTIALTNPTEAQSVLVLITQDGTGSRTLSWPSSIKWPGGTAPTLTTGANKSDWIGIKCVNASTPIYHGFIVGQDFSA